MIDLYYWPTPNGHKVSIALEEMDLAYAVHPIAIGKGEQFEPDFLKISPNNRIPAIVDPDGPGGLPMHLFESGAILLYLARKTGTIADMAIFPWMRSHERYDIKLADYPNVNRWYQAIDARPAVQRGLEILADQRRKGAMSEEEKEVMFGKTQFEQR